MKKMYTRYYVARKPQTNNHHAIHKEGCPFLPGNTDRIYLGIYDCCLDAVIMGKIYYKSARSCLFCLKEYQIETNKIILSEFDYFENMAKDHQIDLSKENSLFYFWN